MVESIETRLDAVFHALGDATRRGMLRRLADGERSVGQLAEPFAMSLAAASKHIKALESAGLIRREIRGRVHMCALEARPLSTASAWLDHYRRFWHDRLDRLEQLLREAGPSTSTATPTGVADRQRAPSRRRAKGNRKHKEPQR